MKVLVTGGGGFLGSAIIRRLHSRGDQIVSLSRCRYVALDSLGVKQVTGDIALEDHVSNAAQGVDAVIHVAAKAGIWGDYAGYYSANVTGTANVINSCRRQGINRLVYTSSPSVIFDNTDIEGGDESLPYPDRYHAPYPETKAVAEKMVLAAASEHLGTVALRPHLIWGPGDNHLVPRIVAKGAAGQLRRISGRECLIDTVYIDNAATAHINALDRLSPSSPISGRAYFITNGEPLPVWEMVDRILAAAGIAPATGSIHPNLAVLMGICCETIWRLFSLRGEPPMTRFAAHELSRSHWFKIDAARNDLGYCPEISIDDGMERLRKWFEAGACR